MKRNIPFWYIPLLSFLGFMIFFFIQNIIGGIKNIISPYCDNGHTLVGIALFHFKVAGLAFILILVLAYIAIKQYKSFRTKG